MNVQRAGRYVLCVVFFALSLFFAGISARLRTETAPGSSRSRSAGSAFVGAVVWLATFPVSVGL